MSHIREILRRLGALRILPFRFAFGKGLRLPLALAARPLFLGSPLVAPALLVRPRFLALLFLFDFFRRQERIERQIKALALGFLVKRIRRQRLTRQKLIVQRGFNLIIAWTLGFGLGFCQPKSLFKVARDQIRGQLVRIVSIFGANGRFIGLASCRAIFLSARPNSGGLSLRAQLVRFQLLGRWQRNAACRAPGLRQGRGFCRQGAFALRLKLLALALLGLRQGFFSARALAHFSVAARRRPQQALARSLGFLRAGLLILGQFVFGGLRRRRVGRFIDILPRRPRHLPALCVRLQRQTRRPVRAGQLFFLAFCDGFGGAWSRRAFFACGLCAGRRRAPRPGIFLPAGRLVVILFLLSKPSHSDSFVQWRFAPFLAPRGAVALGCARFLPSCRASFVWIVFRFLL